jgi:hypothetical protein
MKTLNKINLTILISILSLTAFADEFKLQEEAYINDVPFDTEAIVKAHKQHCAMMVPFQMPEEQNIDDFPLDTRLIVASLPCDSAMQIDFAMPEESYIDDFPLNTYDVLRGNSGIHANNTIYWTIKF